MTNGQNWIGFISSGILTASGTGLTGLNIQFNQDGTPNSFNKGVISWGPSVAPTIPNIKYAVSGIQGAGATAPYMAWRWLWEVTPGQIPSSGPLLVTGVWIAYMRATNPQTLPSGGIAATTTGSFLSDNQYITLDPDDMAGGNVLNSALGTYTPSTYQTQTIPDGKVNFNDVSYFVTAYIAYYTSHIYNPYADLTAQGTINFNDVSAFVTNYIAYYTTYNPPP
jgi:hypothetical protein